MSDIASPRRPTGLDRALFGILPHLALFAALMLAWELAARAGLVNQIIVPRPSAVAAAIWRLYVSEGVIYFHFFVTLWEAVAGFAIGAAIALTLAVSSSLSAPFRRYISPYAIVLNVTPGLALAAVICFFPIFVNALTGLLQIDREREELFRSLGASEYQMFRKLRVPAALPMVFAGLKIGLTTALIGAVVAEFAQATDGVGVLMSRYSFKLDMAASIATLLSMTVIGLLLFYAMEFLDDRMVFWRRDARMTAVSRARARAWRRSVPGTDTAISPGRKD